MPDGLSDGELVIGIVEIVLLDGSLVVSEEGSFVSILLGFKVGA